MVFSLRASARNGGQKGIESFHAEHVAIFGLFCKVEAVQAFEDGPSLEKR